MKRLVFALLAAVTLACGNSTGPRAPDPYLTIRVRDMFDTTQTMGQTEWRLYLFLSGPYSAQNGISPQGSFTRGDVSVGHIEMCMAVASDSVGQRLLTPIAIGDTIQKTLHPDAWYDSVATTFYNGNRTLPVGIVVLGFTPRDAFQSDQYQAGHGLTRGDPIKWGWDWTGANTTTFSERTDFDPSCGRV